MAHSSVPPRRPSLGGRMRALRRRGTRPVPEPGSPLERFCFRARLKSAMGMKLIRPSTTRLGLASGLVARIDVLRAPERERADRFRVFGQHRLEQDRQMIAPMMARENPAHEPVRLVL